MQTRSASSLFPLMNELELKALANDIKTNGLNEKIVLLNGKILDGRNRFKACQLAGIKPQFTQWKNGKDPFAWVISQNLHRRHLTEDQRAVAAAKIQTEMSKHFRQERAKAGAAGRWKCLSATSTGKHRDSRSFAAHMLGVSSHKVRQAIVLLNDHPHVADRIAKGEIGMFHARKLVKEIGRAHA